MADETEAERLFSRTAVTLESSRSIAAAVVGAVGPADGARHAASILLSGAVRIMLAEDGYPATAARLRDMADIVERNDQPGEVTRWN